jgi:predicted dehydrogenase
MAAGLKAVVVGAGWIAEHGHIPGYKQTEGVEVAAICDLVGERVQAVADRFEIPRTYTDWREMLRAERPQIVSVCVPNVIHAEVTLGALAAGAHVLCEKPLATSTSEAVEMFDAARRAGLLLMAAQNVRFRTGNEMIKARIDTGEFGHIYHAEAVYVRRIGIPSWGSFTQKHLSHGGALLDIGVHVLDLAIWFMGNPRPLRVSASTEARFGNRPDVALARKSAWNPARFDVEDFATAYVRFENGATLYLQSAWACHIERDREWVKVLGTDAGATNDPPTIYSFRNGEKVDEVLPAVRIPGWVEGVGHFVGAVRGQAHPRVAEAETLNVQRILDAAYESAESGKEVEIG